MLTPLSSLCTASIYIRQVETCRTCLKFRNMNLSPLCEGKCDKCVILLAPELFFI